MGNAEIFKALSDFSGTVGEWGSLVHKLKFSDRSSDMQGDLINDLSWKKDRLREMVKNGMSPETPFLAVEKALDCSREYYKIQYKKLGDQGVFG